MLYTVGEKQLYFFKDKVGRGDTWKCVERKNKCNAQVIIEVDTGNCIKLTSSTPHNHDSNNEQRYLNTKAMNDAIEKCTKLNALPSGPSLAKTSAIFTSVLVEHQNADIQFKKKKRTLYRLRQGSRPTNPGSIEEIINQFKIEQISDSYGVSLHTEKYPFFDHAFQNDNFAYCIFSSKKTIALIKSIDADERHILMDATFRIVPKSPFTQLLIIYVRHINKVFPFAYILMSRKSTLCYEHALSYFDKNIFSLEAITYTTDYEKAMRNALKKLYPDARFVACYFHFTQAVKRRAWSTDLMHSLLQTNGQALFIYYRIQCLPLLPAEHIPSCFNELRDEAFKINKKVLKPFFSYFEKQWIHEETPARISVSGVSMRTTSLLEANNGVMNKQVVHRANFFTFVRDLRFQEFTTSNNFDEFIKSGGQSEEPRSKYKLRNDQIEKLTMRLRRKEISPMDFLRQLAYKNQLITQSFDNIDEPNSECSDSESDAESECSTATTVAPTSSGSTDYSQSDAPISQTQSNICKKCRILPYSIVLIPCGHLCCESCFQKSNEEFEDSQLNDRPGPKHVKRVAFLKCVLGCGANVMSKQTLLDQSV